MICGGNRHTDHADHPSDVCSLCFLRGTAAFSRGDIGCTPESTFCVQTMSSELKQVPFGSWQKVEVPIDLLNRVLSLLLRDVGLRLLPLPHRLPYLSSVGGKKEGTQQQYNRCGVFLIPPFGCATYPVYDTWYIACEVRGGGGRGEGCVRRESIAVGSDWIRPDFWRHGTYLRREFSRSRQLRRSCHELGVTEEDDLGNLHNARGGQKHRQKSNRRVNQTGTKHACLW